MELRIKMFLVNRTRVECNMSFNFHMVDDGPWLIGELDNVHATNEIVDHSGASLLALLLPNVRYATKVEWGVCVRTGNARSAHFHGGRTLVHRDHGHVLDFVGVNGVPIAIAQIHFFDLNVDWALLNSNMIIIEQFNSNNLPLHFPR